MRRSARISGRKSARKSEQTDDDIPPKKPARGKRGRKTQTNNMMSSTPTKLGNPGPSNSQSVPGRSQGFSPVKLASPLKQISTNISDGGANYDLPCTSTHVFTKPAIKKAKLFDDDDPDDDPDLLMLSQDMDLDPELEESDELPSLSQNAGMPDQGSNDYFSMLPLEVMENIFCRLPILDLCLHVARVCHRWNDIIANDKFLCWKKTYFRVLRGDRKRKETLTQQMVKAGINLTSGITPTTTSPEILPALVRCMMDFKPVTSLNMTECLQQHPRYSWAKSIIEERISDCLTDGIPHPWSVIMVLIILSSCVDDIVAVLHCLLSPVSQCRGVEVIECLYACASYLLVLRQAKYQEHWTILHYRVYYALYLYENSSVIITDTGDDPERPEDCLPTPPASGLRYTQEQLRICNHTVRHGEILKIVAFAGTGKTTTLIRYTQLRPNTSFLLLVFNKSVCADCKRRFPQNVECMTSHSLAYRSGIMSKYSQYKLGTLRVGQITKFLQMRKGENLFQQAKLVLDTINNYQTSADPEITHAHAPFWAQNHKGVREYIGEARRQSVVRDAQHIWGLMLDPRSKLKMTHDTYLKMYQCSKPRIRRYDVILIDEAQDQTPAVIDILNNQPQAKILVGDPNQQIYSFRGAVNAMDLIPATVTYYLTQSFRFGSNIAHVANTCLEVFKGTSHKILVGNSSKGYVDGRRVGQLAILTRSNFALFQEAVRKCSYSQENIKVAFTGGAKAFGFDFLRDLYYLMIGDYSRIKNDYLKTQKSLDALEAYATTTSDLELTGKIKIVRTYNHNVLGHIDRILDKCVENLEEADLVFSTAHKAKGLEFSTVRLTDDFATNFLPHDSIRQGISITSVPGQPNNQTAPDELNLLYVAVTRARKAVQLTPTLMRVLHFGGEKLRVPVLSSAVTPPALCVLCSQTFTPGTAVSLHRQRIALADGREVSAGFYHPACLGTIRSSLAGIFGPLGSESPPPDNIRPENDWQPQGHVVVHAAGLAALLNLPGFDSDDDDF